MHSNMALGSMAKQKTGRLKRNIHLLKALHKSGPAKRKEILQTGGADFMQCVCDCARNVLNGNVPVSAAKLQKLAIHKRVLRKMADPNIPLKQKTKAIKNQTGGFFGALLPALLGPVLSAVSSLVR